MKPRELPQTRQRARSPVAVRERDFMQSVIDLADLLGWLVYYTHDSRRSAAGFPDLVLVRGERLIVAELKTERGRVSNAQSAWLAALDAISGIETYLWRPNDWPVIETTLRHGRDVRPRLASVDAIRKQLDDGEGAS